MSCLHKTIHSLAPSQKQDSLLGVITQWERRTIEAEALLCLCKNRMTLPKNSTRDPAAKVSDELINAKSRHVG